MDVAESARPLHSSKCSAHEFHHVDEHAGGLTFSGSAHWARCIQFAPMVAEWKKGIWEESGGTIDVKTPNKEAMRPFLVAQAWRNEMLTDPSLKLATIAAQQGLSRARVIQIMNLLGLPQHIQAELQNPPPPLHVHLFNERKLRSSVAIQEPA